MADQGATVLAAERGGTSARVEALWRDVGGPLRAFVAHHVAGAQDADDVVAEVFLRVAARIDDVRDDERLVGWVYRIARNAIVDHYRSAPRPGGAHGGAA